MQIEGGAQARVRWRFHFVGARKQLSAAGRWIAAFWETLHETRQGAQGLVINLAI